MTDSQRDFNIIESYKSGKTQDELAVLFELTPARIWQILHENGMSRTDRPTVTSDRSMYLGVHLTPMVKEALRETAAHDGVSMSEFVSNIIVRELERRGIEVRVFINESSEEDVPLPLEAE